MARRSQCSSTGDNPLNPNYLPPHYREEYRLAIDALVEEDVEGYCQFLQKTDVVDFLSISEIEYIQSSIQVPQRSNYPEQRFLETGGDGSSDTYWPIHSDLDAPGLDLGWPQLHHFMGPTEVTTLVNPPEPDMPSIKEQARRLIKNAQQVIAIVMDMFTDVDIFADILSAAMRNVAVYIILDNHNAHHFMNMVSHCRVNLQSIQFLRVRTVTGITYQCRSGKSFKGQMMDRFLLTDCRAVLSGNYSFMWSFEKLHRCMAHLFFGQLVTTFDEEFRILYAQSQPLMMENAVVPVEDRNLLHNRQYPSERTSLFREPRKFLSLDTPHPEELGRHSYDERMDVDWRMMPLKRQEAMHGPADMYSRFPSHQSRMDPSFDQGASRMPMMENAAFKRHSYAEGVHGRYSFPYLPQQGVPEPEPQGRQFHRGQQPYPVPGPGQEADYGAYDKFWNQDYHSTDQYPEPGLPQEMDLPDFDPVLNYISSTRNVDFDEGSEKFTPAADLPFSSSHPQRLSVGQMYACQTSPTPSNPTEQKQFFQEPNTDRKDPMVKRGLRNWRISSYLSTYDNPDESLPSGPPNAPDPFEDLSNPIQPTAPALDLPAHKIPNVREFKVPAIPRASQLPSYAKTTAREQPKKLPDESTVLVAETKTPTPTPSESSSTTEGEKTEETEQKELRTAIVQRDDSFRRKYSAAVQRSSRLRSSLIFSSLEQQHTSEDNKTAPGQQDEESEKTEAEQTKLSFASQVLGQRRSTPREPFEWSRFIKSATADNSATDPSKTNAGPSREDDTDSSKDKNEDQESSKLPDEDQANSSPSQPQSNPSETQLPKPNQPTKPPELLFTSPLHLDMNDPDNRLRFFKELAAKRKAAKAAETEKSKEKGPIKPPPDQKTTNTTVKREEPASKETPETSDISTSVALSEKNAAAEDAGKTAIIGTCKLGSVSLDTSDKTNMDSQAKTDPSAPQSSKEEQTRVSTDLEKVEHRSSQSPAAPPVPVEIEAPQSELLQEPQESNLTREKNCPTHPPTPTIATPDNVPSLAQGADKREITCFDSTSKESSSLTSKSVEEPPSSFFSASVLDSNIQNPESFQSETSISSPPQTGLEFRSSNPSVQSSSSDHFLPDSGSQISQSPLPSSHILSETISFDTASDESSSTLTSGTLSPNAQEIINPSAPEPSQTAEETSTKSTASSVSPTESETSQVHLDPVSKLTCALTLDVAESEQYQKDSGEKCEDLESSQDMKADSPPHSLSLSLPKSCLPNVSDMESKPRSDQNETVTSPLSPPEHLLAEASSPVYPDVSATQSETAVFLQDAPTEVPPSDLNLKGCATPTPTETVSCSSPLTESVGTVLSPEGEKTLSTVHSPTNTNPLPEQVPTDSEETEVLPSAETCGPTESASDVPTELDLPCQTPESVTSESQTEETPVPTKNSNMDCQNEDSTEPEIPGPGEKKAGDTEATNKVNTTTADESVCSEKANDQVRQNSCSEMPEIPSDEVLPPSSQPKQPKSSQSRYHSSTANVLSSSNLRDDTKLLLEQISANSQSRNESKESPVTDDEKEDEADKNAIREKERGFRSFRREPPKSSQEREKLLERIQSMRKERKVYSRFEMAP